MPQSSPSASCSRLFTCSQREYQWGSVRSSWFSVVRPKAGAKGSSSTSSSDSSVPSVTISLPSPPSSFTQAATRPNVGDRKWYRVESRSGWGAPVSTAADCTKGSSGGATETGRLGRLRLDLLFSMLLPNLRPCRAIVGSPFWRALDSLRKYFCACVRICTTVRVLIREAIFFHPLPCISSPLMKVRCSSRVQRPVVSLLNESASTSPSMPNMARSSSLSKPVYELIRSMFDVMGLIEASLGNDSFTTSTETAAIKKSNGSARTRSGYMQVALEWLVE
mmetsp:Transcript_19975/g.44439  ORF Transcript_19975/g.44439 Transcript_19975/m.44439 type:complete len:278 (+) Transcript_19975:537-1370(+)